MLPTASFVGGTGMVMLSLLAHRIGVSHNPGFGRGKALLLLSGLPLSVFGAWVLCTPPKRERLFPIILGYAGTAVITLALAAHRLGLGHNPELRWTKTLLFILGVGLAFAAGRLFYSRGRAENVFRSALAYLGLVTIAVAAAVHPLGLAKDPAFRWKRQLLLGFGLCMSGVAALFPLRLRIQEWFLARRNQFTRAIPVLTGLATVVLAFAVDRTGAGNHPVFGWGRQLILLAGLGVTVTSYSLVYRPLIIRWLLARLAAIPLGWRHRIAILALPWIIFLVNPNWPFQSLGHMDPWYYFGEFIHFPHYQRLMGGYAGERLMWILPGLTLVRILSPAYGILVLEIGFYSLSVLSLYYVVDRFTDARTALLTSCLMACHPLFIGASGWSYLDGASIGYFLLTFALIVKAESSNFRRLLLVFAGMSWASLVYTYILWLALTPCCVYLDYASHRTVHSPSVRDVCRRVLSFLTFFSLGAVVLTFALQSVHTFVYGPGNGFFFRSNIATAFGILAMRESPWSSGNFRWIYSAGWIVFPVLAFVVCIALLLQWRRSAIKRDAPVIPFVSIYLYCFAVMVVMTIRPTRVLEFDYFASILIPSLFLVLGVTVLKVPDKLPDRWFYLLLALCCATCSLPLWKVNLYRMALIDGLVFTYAIGLAGLAIRLAIPKGTLSWIILIGVLCVVSFVLVPNYPGAAWRMEYNGLAAMKRIASAVTLIENRLPAQAFPAFWINNVDNKYTSEYRAIMCAFQSHGLSMYEYPKIDPTRVYKPGTFLILITENQDVFGEASATMSRAGMPLCLYGQDLVAADGVSYWLTYVRVVSGGEHAVRQDCAGPAMAGRNN